MTKNNRSSFTGKLGFVLAAAGSAVGLGNLWRFPYLAAEHGGGIFLLVYLILAVTFGFALMTAEIAIGRKTGLSAIGAFQKLNNKFSFIGYLAAIVPVIILPYYSVIGGWVSKFLFEFVRGNAASTAVSKFDHFDENGKEVLKSYFEYFMEETGEPIFWFSLFLGLTALAVFLGVEKGIEKVSKIMMPVLAVLAVAIAVYSCIFDIKSSGGKGLLYYIVPDFKNFSITTVLAAMGQLFYSMSLAMGIMITYGSYMKKDVSIESSVKNIEIFDTGIAFTAGLMIIPAIYATGNENLLTKGPSLMFIVLPKVFDSMNVGGFPIGNFVGAAFFILVFFAAITSSISLMETVVSFVIDKFKFGRKTSCLIVFILSVIIGLPSSLGYGLLKNVLPLGMDILTFFDFISNSVLMPIVAFLTCILVAYVVGTKSIEDEVELTGVFKKKKMFRVIIKYVAPICIVLILVFSVLENLGFIAV